MTTNYTGFLTLSGSDNDTIGDTSSYSGTFGVTLTATLDAMGNGIATETVGRSTSVISYRYNYTPSGYGTGSGTAPFYFTTPTLIFKQGTFQSSQFKIPIKVGDSYFYATLSGSITNQGEISEQLAGTISGVNQEGHSFAGTLDGDTTLACFLKGTEITTPEGRVAVESLTIGDMVALSAGGTGRISWIGQRSVDCSRHPNPGIVWPVRVVASAFGPGLPVRDLYLSPDHAIFVNDVFVPVKYLMNGTSIAQVKRDQVRYFHLELERHDVILAEGLPVESYLDTGNRLNFENGGGPIALHPEFSAHSWDTAHIWEALACAPLIVTGPKLAAARAVVLKGIVLREQAQSIL
jgi:hypothetical protein